MDILHFDGRLQEWKGNSEGRTAFFAAVAQALYANPESFGFEGVDEAADALLTHRNRIISLLDRYREQGSTFEGYVATSLRFLAKSSRRKRKRAYERSMACERSIDFGLQPPGEWESEDASVLGTSIGPENERPTGPSSRRHRRARNTRILFLLMKCAWEAGDREVKIAAEITGMSEVWISTTLAHARRFLEVERCRFERITARRDRSWSAMRIYESRLSEVTIGHERDDLLRSLQRARREYDMALAELKNFRPLVPNSVVARLLKVPKGSVDSGIHYLRKSEAAPKPEIR